MITCFEIVFEGVSRLFNSGISGRKWSDAIWQYCRCFYLNKTNKKPYLLIRLEAPQRQEHVYLSERNNLVPLSLSPSQPQSSFICLPNWLLTSLLCHWPKYRSFCGSTLCKTCMFSQPTRQNPAPFNFALRVCSVLLWLPTTHALNSSQRSLLIQNVWFIHFNLKSIPLPPPFGEMPPYPSSPLFNINFSMIPSPALSQSPCVLNTLYKSLLYWWFNLPKNMPCLSALLPYILVWYLSFLYLSNFFWKKGLARACTRLGVVII